MFARSVEASLNLFILVIKGGYDMIEEKCPYCNAKVSEGEDYCSACGAGIAWLWDACGLELFGGMWG